MVSPPSADFGDVVQGASSTTPTIFTVTSTGAAIALAPTVTGPFALVSNTCEILAAGGECTLGLAFNPVVLGSASGVLTVAAGVTASLTGTGIVSPASLAFTQPTLAVSTPIGMSSSVITFNLVNSGGADSGALTVTPGGDVDKFTIDNQCIAPLASLSSCKIDVVFKPTRVRLLSTLTLTVTDANSPTTSVLATVNGMGEEAMVIDFGSAAVGDFGTVAVGATSPAHDFTLFNPAESDSGILTIAVTDTQFVVTADGCSNLPLASGKSCTLSIVFKPSAPGGWTADLKISASGGWGTSYLSMKGVGVEPLASLAFQAPTTVTVSTMIGVSSSPVSFNLINLGSSATGALTVTPGGNVDQFTIDNLCIAPLAALSFCRISVVCKPTSTGQKTLTLTVTDANSPTTAVVATVNGVGGSSGQPAIQGTGDFGTVAVGATSPAHDFTLTNPGATDSGILTLAVTDTQFVVTSDGCSNLPLASGKSCTFSMVFKPSAPGATGATVSISSPGTPSASMPIKGLGVVTAP